MSVFNAINRKGKPYNSGHAYVRIVLRAKLVSDWRSTVFRWDLHLICGHTKLNMRSGVYGIKPRTTICDQCKREGNKRKYYVHADDASPE